MDNLILTNWLTKVNQVAYCFENRVATNTGRVHIILTVVKAWALPGPSQVGSFIKRLWLDLSRGGIRGDQSLTLISGSQPMNLAVKLLKLLKLILSECLNQFTWLKSCPDSIFEFQEWELGISGLRIFYWNHAPLVKCFFSLELIDQEEPFLTFFFRPTAKKSPVKYTYLWRFGINYKWNSLLIFVG